MWTDCLVSTLDPSFMVVGRGIRGGRTAWSGYGIAEWCVVFDEWQYWTWPPVIILSLSIFCIVPLWPATTVCTYFRFRQVLFRYIGVIAHVFCHADVLVCLFVVNVANFWYAVIESRLSNSKLHYEFMVLYFWLLSFAWDPSTSSQSHFLLQLFFCLLIPIWNSFVSVAILIGFLFVGTRKLGRCQMTRLI